MKSYFVSLYLPLLVLMLPIQGCASTGYSAEPIEAWVVDDETGKPLEGVVVNAFWVLKQGSYAGGGVAPPPLQVLETVTDSKGRFYFPAWGPIQNTTANSYFWGNDPLIILFKRGYDFFYMDNRITGEPTLDPLRKSDWNGATAKLKKFKGDNQKYADRIDDLEGDYFMFYVGQGYNCDWKKTPRMLVELHRMGEEFERQGIKIIGYPGKKIGDLKKYSNKGMCGSAEEFLRSYLP